MLDSHHLGFTPGAAARAWLAITALAAAVLLGSAPAAAAGLVSATPASGTSATHDALRPSDAQYFISHQDCVDNLTLDFDVTVPAGMTTGFQVWASESAGCQASAARVGSGSGTAASCVSLASAYPSNGRISIHVADLAHVLSGVSGCTDSSTSTAQRQLYLYFMLVGTDDPVLDDDTFIWTKTSVDLTGPAPPSGSGFGLGIGDGLLLLNLPAGADPDTRGYYVFCDPNPEPPTDAVDPGCDGGTTTTGSGGAGGSGGAAADAGEGGADAGSGSTACASVDPSKRQLGCLDAAHPSITSPYVCGARISATATAPVLMGLTNETQYTIAVAAYDEADNLGPLSVLQCGTPLPADTFFPQYCADGGEGCGGCAVSAVGALGDRGWPWLLAAALAALAVTGRRQLGVGATSRGSKQPRQRAS